MPEGPQAAPRGRPGVRLEAKAEGFPGERHEPHVSPPTPMSQGVIQGTIPYLGTFLTDLVMLDTAMKDYLYVSEPGAGRGGP